MLHLWKNDSGIQDVRQWLLNDLAEIERTLVEEGDAGDAAEKLGEVISRLCILTDSDQRTPGLNKSSSIGDDEPVVVLRATDHFAIGALKRYMQLAHAAGLDAQWVLGVLKWIGTMNEYAASHASLAELPSMQSELVAETR
jgi:hypothetical protein